MGKAPDAKRFGFRGTQSNQRPDDEVRLLRDDLDHLPGLVASQRRLTAHSMRLYPAWNSLELGIDVDAALDYIERPLKAAGLPADQYGRLVGIILGFGITMIEAERERAARESALRGWGRGQGDAMT